MTCNFNFSILKYSLFPLLVIAIVGCARSPTRSDCTQANFYEMGVRDGKDGKTAERLQRYQNICGPEQMSTLTERYEYGRQVGLVDYCDERRARRDAREARMSEVCSAANVPPYMAAYTRELERNRENIQKELEEVRAERERLQRREAQLQTQINQMPTEGGASL